MKMEGQNDYKRRLWIGHINPLVTEYQLLKLLQQYGKIEKFDFHVHLNGPNAGQPKGYAFVTYINQENAIEALFQLNNKRSSTSDAIMKIVAKWAHVSSGNEEKPKRKSTNILPALMVTSSGCSSSNSNKKTDPFGERQRQIAAIESKLKQMENTSSNPNEILAINETVSNRPSVIPQVKRDEMNVNSHTVQINRKRIKYDGRGRRKPYHNIYFHR